MIRLVDKSKISTFKFIYLFILVLFAGMSTVFARSLGDIRTIGNGFMLLLTVILIFKYHIKFKKNYVLSISIFSLYAVITFIANGVISPFWWSQWLIWLTIAYCVCYSFGWKLFASYETILTFLCIISLPLWLIYILFPDALRIVMKTIEFSKPFSEDGNVGINILFYTIPPTNNIENDYIIFPRNCGFAWEPGAFSCLINLALFCNIFRTNIRFKHNTSLWIFIVALITTQSTTGFIIFIMLLLSWLLLKHSLWYTIILIPVVVVLFNLPFVKDKFLEEYNTVQYVDVSSLGTNRSYALGRLSSFQLDLEEFSRHPILGLGGYEKGRYLNKMGYDNIATISGVGKLLSKFGIIMSIVFFYLLIKSAMLISKLYNNNRGYLLFIVILGSMISYDLWTTPILISFWIFGYFFDTTSKKLNRITSFHI